MTNCANLLRTDTGTARTHDIQGGRRRSASQGARTGATVGLMGEPTATSRCAAACSPSACSTTSTWCPPPTASGSTWAPAPAPADPDVRLRRLGRLGRARQRGRRRSIPSPRSGGYRLRDWLRLRLLFARAGPGRRLAGRAGRGAGRPARSTIRCTRARSWVRERVLGGAIELGIGIRGLVGADPDHVASCCPAAGRAVGLDTSRWWPALRARLEEMGELAAARLRRDGSGLIAPMGGCDVLTLLGAGWLRSHLADRGRHRDAWGGRPDALPRLVRPGPDRPGLRVGRGAPRPTELRGVWRPLLVTAEEVATRSLLPEARAAASSLRGPGRSRAACRSRRALPPSPLTGGPRSGACGASSMAGSSRASSSTIRRVDVLAGQARWPAGSRRARRGRGTARGMPSASTGDVEPGVAATSRRQPRPTPADPHAVLDDDDQAHARGPARPARGRPGAPSAGPPRWRDMPCAVSRCATSRPMRPSGRR